MSAARYLRDVAVFAPCYVALDWASYIDPVGPFNITPWNPQPALAIAWMLLAGMHYAPAVFATIVVADVLVRETPGGYLITAFTGLALAGGYAWIAWTLRALMPDTGLRSTRQLTIFAAVILAGTAIVGAAFIGVLRGADLLAQMQAPSAWLRFWIGDAVGVLVTAPLLLAAADTQRRVALLGLARKPETWAQVAVLAATIWLIFEGLGGDPSRYFYLLFVPLIWIAARSGLNGAVVATAIVQLGVVAGIHRDGGIAPPIIELQALVAALTLTGLYLGVMVDERRQAAESLRQSLRLAAAGEMAGAITHELNQPLTALANYAQSAQTLLARKADAARLQEVVGRILAEAQRAAEVVRRLRDFFRDGTTRLELVEYRDLLAAARRIGEQIIGPRAISLELRADAQIPRLYVDRLQVELVLRNLISNAVDSLATRGEPGARIEISAEQHDSGHVRIVVADNGPGVRPATRERLFEPFVSGRPSGMGLGLAVSRAIAEAHGGSLQAASAGRGEFHLILPCARES